MQEVPVRAEHDSLEGIPLHRCSDTSHSVTESLLTKLQPLDISPRGHLPRYRLWCFTAWEPEVFRLPSGRIRRPMLDVAWATSPTFTAISLPAQPSREQGIQQAHSDFAVAYPVPTLLLPHRRYDRWKPRGDLRLPDKLNRTNIRQMSLPRCRPWVDCDFAGAPNNGNSTYRRIPLAAQVEVKEEQLAPLPMCSIRTLDAIERHGDHRDRRV